MNIIRFCYIKYFYIELVKSRLCTLYTRLKYKINPSIYIGKNPIFYGQPLFINMPGATIKVSDNCTFRSYATSNLIGINRPCMLSTMTNKAEIVIGNNCGFSGTVIGAFINIRLGDNVRCGANTLITDADWHLNDSRSGKPNPVFIQDNVWLGEGVKILKGVTIGKNTVIGIGSVVTKNIPANVVAGGNPCHVIKKIG